MLNALEVTVFAAPLKHLSSVMSSKVQSQQSEWAERRSEQGASGGTKLLLDRPFGVTMKNYLGLESATRTIAPSIRSLHGWVG